ncbi:MAG: hypothetical protein RRY23_08310 [Alistipes sp.]
MKMLSLILWSCLFFVPADAQQRDSKKEYDAFKKQAFQSYSDFRDKANAEYAKFMKQAWQKYNAEPAIAAPVPDPPVQPVYVSPDQPTDPKPLPYNRVVVIDSDIIRPEPVAPIPASQNPVMETVAFDFFGANCSVRADKSNPVLMSGTDENAVGAAWGQFSESRFNDMVTDCLRLRDELQLCDWAYYLLTRKLAAAYYNADNCAEGIVLQTYLLTQSGYRIRLAQANGKLSILFPTETAIYRRMYTEIDGIRYYFLDPNFQGGSFYVCNFAFPGEHSFSLYMKTQPRLPVEETLCRIFTAQRHPEISVEMCSNQHLIDFYATYPPCHWDVFALASLSDHKKETLYPVLKTAIAGKSEAEAANILINFVQTAFEYQTDQEQFGVERSLFADETLYYPYSDCEDRAILYSVLVRELLGLETVLLHYPTHLATAVCFNNDVSGDYIDLDGRRYIVCDPTYSGANIGQTMPGMDNQNAEIIIL